MTVGEVGAGWLAGQAHLKPSTLHSVESAWRTHVEPAWGASPVSEVRFSAVQAWVTPLAAQRSATAVLRAHGVLASVLETAVRDRRILANPLRPA